MIVVSDTTPLTYLLQIDEVGLLSKLFRKTIIPPSVRDELLAFEPTQTAAESFLQESWVKVLAPSSGLQMPLRYQLDAGELEAIALAVELKADLLLIDERKGVAVANDFQLQSTGLIGVLITAKKEGYLSTIKPHLDEIMNLGFYISDKFYKAALRLVSE